MRVSEHDAHRGNGITIAGEYLSVASNATLEQVALSQKKDEALLQELKPMVKRPAPPAPFPEQHDLGETGWGVIFATTADPRIRDALRPLLDHRREAAARYSEDRYQEYDRPDPYTGKRGYYPGQDSPHHFLHENGVRTIGRVDPDELPYYLLIVGDPATIPYAFQSRLSLHYAVGRIDFGEDIAAYERYAHNVVAAERSPIARPHHAAFWAPRIGNDPVTVALADSLVAPLLNDTLPEQFGAGSDWELRSFLHEQADKHSLAHLLGGPDTPALLLAASHGVAFPPGHEHQTRDQGALLCQNWPGPDSGPLSPNHYFASGDLDSTVNLQGLIAFFLSSYSGGTPEHDPLSTVTGTPSRIAEHPFLADLPRQLLAHPNGSALAIVAHTARLWGYSLPHGASPLAPALASTLAALMQQGWPVGAACSPFRRRYAEAATRLDDAIYKYRVHDKEGDRLLIPGLWADANDTYHYTIMGDPAARIVPATAPPPPPPPAPTVATQPQEKPKPKPKPEEPVAPPRKEESMSEKLVFNGVRIDGSYETVATEEMLIKLAEGRKISDEELDELDYRHNQKQAHFSVDADVRDLSATGWGIIFTYNADPRIYEALKPLRDHRREQAAKVKEHRYQEYYRYDEATGKRGFAPGEDSKADFLLANGANASGQVNPDQMPYYLLIVGSPEDIPYEFQYQMDVQYAVGRIYFDDIESYAIYAHSVVAAETGKVALPRRAAFWGVRTSGDPATEMSADHLITPLVNEELPSKRQLKIEEYERLLQNATTDADKERFQRWLQEVQAWEFTTMLKDKAFRDDLGGLLTGPVPSLLFTASHGMAFPNGHERQMLDQGALLCQDWPGPRSGAVQRKHYFSGEDIQNENANLLGMIAFFFACYGGGTPMLDQFAHATGDTAQIAERNFLANLPRQLLSHKNGGALAVVAHVERAWGYSFMTRNKSQLNVFRDAFSYLMLDGKPIGAAIELFNEQYAEKSTVLTETLQQVKFGNARKKRELPGLWTDNNDARGYVVIGDPAARLPLAPIDTPEPIYAAIDLDRVKKTVAAAQSAAPAAGSAAAAAAAAAAADAPAADSATEAAPAPNFAAADEREGSEAQNYGMLDVFSGDKGVSKSLKDFATKMSETLQAVVEDMTTLEVSTYVSENINDVVKDIATERESGKIYLRARSTIRLDGDTDTVLPMEDGEVDLDIWDIHKEIVAQAQQNRNELIEILLSLIELRK